MNIVDFTVSCNSRQIQKILISFMYFKHTDKTLKRF